MALVHNLPRTVGEVFEALKGAKTKGERAKILQENDNLAVRSILRLNFDPKLKFELPEGFPANYKPNPKPTGFGEVTLKSIVKKFYIFVKESTPNLRQFKREQIFGQLLEQLSHQEATVLVEAKDKKLNVGLTRKLVEEIFPDLLPADAKSIKETKTSGDLDETEGADKVV